MQLGPYTLQSLLLETAVSRIYVAERSDGALVGSLVCKVFQVADEAFSQALTERARGLMQLGSPNLLQVLDVGRMGSQLVVVRPRLKALMLQDLVERSRQARRAIGAGVAMRLVMDLLTGLQVAHAHRRPGSLDPWLTHGEVSPDHVMVDDTGRALLVGMETPRGPRPAVPTPVRLDLSGACALLYDLLNPRRGGAEPAAHVAPVPPEFSALLTQAMGLSGTRHQSAVDLKDALLETARKVGTAVAPSEEVATLVRRLLETAPEKPAPAPPPASRPAAPTAMMAPVPATPAPVAVGQAFPAMSAEPRAVMGSPLEGAAGLPGGGLGNMFSVPRPVSGIIFSAPKLKQPRLGELLRSKGFISDGQLDGALARQKVGGGKLGSLLLDERAIDDGQLADALSELSGHPRAPDADIRRAQPNEFLLATVPAHLAIQKRVMPVSLDANTRQVTVAVEDPFDGQTVRQVQLLVGASSVKVVVARRAALDDLLRAAFPREHGQGRPAPQATEVPRFGPSGTIPGQKPPHNGPAEPPPSLVMGQALQQHAVLDPAFGQDTLGGDAPAAGMTLMREEDLTLRPSLEVTSDDLGPPVDEPTPPEGLRLPDAPPRMALEGNPLVLVCEPDAMLATALTARLQADDLRVMVVTDGNQARVAIERENPSAIISEAALPKVDGLSLLLGVRAKDATREVPFFILSARYDEKQTSKALDLGADDFLPKPLNTDLLAGKLKRALVRYQSMMRSRVEAAEEREANAPPPLPTAAPQQQNAPAGPAAPPPADGQVRVKLKKSGSSSASLPAPPPPAPPPDPEPPRPAEPTGVIGSLVQMGLPEIVQSLELGRKTAVVTLMFNERGEGQVSFLEGEVVNATYAAFTGEDAFYAMTRMKQGLFRIHYGKPKDETRTINVSTTFLLLEAMRRMDEEPTEA